VLTGDEDLRLPEVEISSSMVELYEGVTFSPGQNESLTG